jgi:hypothetical protein
MMVSLVIFEASSVCYPATAGPPFATLPQYLELEEPVSEQLQADRTLSTTLRKGSTNANMFSMQKPPSVRLLNSKFQAVS